MPWFSFFKASVCLSVTDSPPFSLRLGFASFSNSPRADHVTCIVDYTLEGAPRLVRYPAHDPALFVYILFFSRQLADVADELLAHHLAILVEDGLDDIPMLVDCTSRDQASSVGASGFLSALVRSFFRTSRLLAGDFARAFGHLSRRISRPLGGLGGTLTDLLGSLSGTLSGFACAFTDFLDGLTRTLPDLTRRLPGAFADLLGSLTGALTDVFHCRLGSRAHVLHSRTRTLYGFPGTGTNILDSRARTRAHVFYGRTCALYSLTGTFTHIFDSGTCAGAHVLHSRTGTRTNVLYCRTGSGAYIGDRLVRPFADEITRTGTDILNRRSGTRTYIGDRLVGALSHEISGTRAYVRNRLVRPFADQLTGAFTHILDRRVDPFAHQLTCAFADVFDGRSDALDQLFDDLGVTVYGRQDPVEYGGHVVEPYLEEGLGFDALYHEFDPAEVGVNPDRELHQIQHLREQVDLRPEIVELEVDLIYLDYGHV